MPTFGKEGFKFGESTVPTYIPITNAETTMIRVQHTIIEMTLYLSHLPKHFLKC